jgi:dCTP deaminase
MILSDTMILEAIEDGRLFINPDLGPGQLQPASIDCTLSNTFLTMDTHYQGDIDPRNVDQTMYRTQLITQSPDDYFLLEPGAFALGATNELVGLTAQPVKIYHEEPSFFGNTPRTAVVEERTPLVGRVEGKSSLGRIGLMVHITAGFIDPGFVGTITLEFHNCSPHPIRLYAGMKICQLSFFETGRVENPYNVTGRYQHQTTVTPSKGVA